MTKRTAPSEPEHAGVGVGTAVQPQPQIQETGIRACIRYARLALCALILPLAAVLTTLLARRVPAVLRELSAGMRVYLLLNTALYSAAALAFLANLPGLHVGMIGFGFVDQPVLHLLWGLTALAVAALQVAVLLTGRWDVYQTCAIVTVTWAAMWCGVMVLLAYRDGGTGLAIIWAWITVMHYLLIGNHLVPVRIRTAGGMPPTARSTAQNETGETETGAIDREVQRLTAHASTPEALAEEYALASALAAMLREPSEAEQRQTRAQMHRPVAVGALGAT